MASEVFTYNRKRFARKARGSAHAVSYLASAQKRCQENVDRRQKRTAGPFGPAAAPDPSVRMPALLPLGPQLAVQPAVALSVRDQGVGIPAGELTGSLYVHYEDRAVQHLLAVATFEQEAARAELRAMLTGSTPADMAMTQADQGTGGKDDLQALRTALKMEECSIDYYTKLAKEATNPLARRFFMSVAHEERGHYLTLMDMHNYLTLPEDWFYVKQMSNVDGA